MDTDEDPAENPVPGIDPAAFVHAGSVCEGAGAWIPCTVPGDNPWLGYNAHRQQHDPGAPAGND